MTANAITLLGQGLEVSLTRARGGNHPREQIELPELERTANGAINRDGPSYRPPHIWDLAFAVDQAQRDRLLVMHSAWRDTGASVLIHDTVTPYVEATRTRALVPTYTTTTLGGRVLYFAQFRGEFQGDLGIESLGMGWYGVQFQLFETTIVPA